MHKKNNMTTSMREVLSNIDYYKTFPLSMVKDKLESLWHEYNTLKYGTQQWEHAKQQEEMLDMTR